MQAKKRLAVKQTRVRSSVKLRRNDTTIKAERGTITIIAVIMHELRMGVWKRNDLVLKQTRSPPSIGNNARSKKQATQTLLNTFQKD